MTLRPPHLAHALLFFTLLAGCSGEAATSGSGNDGGSGAASSGTTMGSGNAETGVSAGASSGRLASGGATAGSGLAVTSGAAASGGSSGAAASGSSADGAACAKIDPSSYDVSCEHDTDCIAVPAGSFCSGDQYACTCPNAAINVSDQERYETALSSALASIHGGSLCSCPAFTPPQCLQGVCTACRGAPDDPPACHSSAPDASADGSACVNVDVTTYDQSCQTASDCMDITSGVLCPGACLCGGSAVNVSESLRYESSISQLSTHIACPCAYRGPVACIQNHCAECGVGSTGPDCPDGG